MNPNVRCGIVPFGGARTTTYQEAQHRPITLAGNSAYGAVLGGIAPAPRKKKQQEVVGKVTEGTSGAAAAQHDRTATAGAARGITQGHHLAKERAKPVKTAQISLLPDDKEFWRPNSSVEVFQRYSVRDRDQPESHLRRMQHSQIDLAHDMTPLDPHSRIVASRPSRPQERLYGDPYEKLQERVKPKPAPVNSRFRQAGAPENPENYCRAPKRVSKAASPDRDIRARVLADDDRSFQPFNSEHYRGHVNAVDKIGLRNDGPLDHPIVFQYNGGDFRRSYFQPYEYSAVDRARMKASIQSQSPGRARHGVAWRK